MPATGPLRAKSNNAARLGGKERIGVIPAITKENNDSIVSDKQEVVNKRAKTKSVSLHPKVPNCGLGMGVGRPILIFRILATT